MALAEEFFRRGIGVGLLGGVAEGLGDVQGRELVVYFWTQQKSKVLGARLANLGRPGRREG